MKDRDETVEEGTGAKGRGPRSGEEAEIAFEEDGSVLSDPAREIDGLKAERDQIYDRWLRSQADFDNFRKRTERDREMFRAQSREAIVRDLLPVLDNFERALASMPPETPHGVAAGIGLIHRQLQDALARQGVVPMEALGETFDPRMHEAVATRILTHEPPNRIVAEAQKGYLLNDRVLRPALVTVSVSPESEPEPEAEEDPS